MSENILKALMQLFAIVVEVEGISKNSRLIVESFLKQQLNQELVEEYLSLFDEFIAKQNSKADGTQRRKKISGSSVKVLKICTEINEELAQRQKVVVLIRLLEFIFSDGKKAAEQELEFVHTVSEIFNIPEEEFQDAKAFVEAGAKDKIDLESVLIIDHKEKSDLKNGKHIYSEGMDDGEMRVLMVRSVNMLLLKYLGRQELYLNGQVLTPGRTSILNQGSSLRSTKVQPIYYSDILSSFLADSSAEKIVFEVKNLEYVFKGGNIGMHTLNFTEESGKLFGVMGASGAGKSTLLNLLNGNYTPTKGSVTINGISIHDQSQKERIEGVIGFVSQDDLLIEELTVFQNLYYNAKLCFDKLSDKEIEKLVEDTLHSLGLFETRDLKVGSPLDKTISGGQRKRLNIALELIREPAVLFVDEPTSGLSSRDSENIMDLLKQLALKGKLVFVVIHQPSSDIYKMFDKLFILDTGGYPIYIGDPVDAVIYFKEMVNHVNANESECPKCGNVNPEQVFNIIESKVVDEYGNLTKNRKISPKEWYKFYLDRFKETTGKVSAIISDYNSTFQIPNKLKQFKVFITRDVLSKLTNTQYLVINLLEAPVLAFILAFIVKYYNQDASNQVGYILRENENMPAYIFMSVIVALFIGLTVSAEEIIRDQKILKREKFLNLSKDSYLLSKITIMFVLSAIQALTFVLVGNYVLDIRGMWFDYWFVLFSTACFANMLGLNISASFNSAVTIYILIPFLIIPQLILSGVIVKFDKLNPVITVQNSVPISGEIMASRWAFEALAVNQYKNNKFEKDFYPLDKELKNAEYKKNYWIRRLESKVSLLQNNLKDPEKLAELSADFDLIRRELLKELKETPQVSFDNLEGLKNFSVEQFTPAMLNEIKDYLQVLNKYYIKHYNNYYDKKDVIISKRNSSEEEKAAYIQLKDNYTNDALADLVTDKTGINKILEADGKLYQKSNPVYLDSKNFRAHFFAPNKTLFGQKIHTFWANVMVLWIMSLMLAITLKFDALRKLIEGLSKTFSSMFKK
ncbi:MAG: ATP-binding cassette domain-containing protein [Vicingaceae bacterium]